MIIVLYIVIALALWSLLGALILAVIDKNDAIKNWTFCSPFWWFPIFVHLTFPYWVYRWLTDK